MNYWGIFFILSCWILPQAAMYVLRKDLEEENNPLTAATDKRS